jgi:MarR family transcriptional regulator, organic hydroperoxide resistance regulator
MTAPSPADLIQLLTRADRLMTRRLAAILLDADLSVDAWRVMTLLSDGLGHQMTEVADQAFLPPATLTKLMDHLVDVNIVYRRVDAVDRRRIRAYLTPRGRVLHRDVSADLDASIAGLLPSDGHDVLVTHLSRLADGLAAEPKATVAR